MIFFCQWDYLKNIISLVNKSFFYSWLKENNIEIKNLCFFGDFKLDNLKSYVPANMILVTLI